MSALAIPTAAELEAALKDIPLNDLRILLDAEECERDLFTYFERSWQTHDSSAFQWGWHLEAIADHLMAVSDGDIRRLLINIPPRFSKTKLVSVAWPTWTWAHKRVPDTPLLGPEVEFLCVSYGTDKATEDAVTARRVIASEWYQQRWGEKSDCKRVIIAKDRDNQGRYDTIKGGSRISTGIEASILGRGGNIKIIDDAHKPDEVESDLVRDGVIRAYDETLSSRENDPNVAAEVIVMQRLHEGDLAGHVLERFGSDPDKGGFVHLCLPAEFEPERKCYTVLGWEDPRTEEGESLWPERYTPEALARRKVQEGPFSWSAKYQQTPVPRGGGILRAEWWRLWRKDEFPNFSTVIVSLDTASTEKEENDESALTAWGAWADDAGRPNMMLIDGWEGFLEFSPLLQRTMDMARKHRADTLLVENKNVGQGMAQEIRRIVSRQELSVIEINPRGDKVARAVSIQHMFSGDLVKDKITGMETWTGGLIWAPDKDWAQLVIDRCASFPKGRRKGIVDTVTQAIKYLRDNGIIVRTDEWDDERLEERMYRKPRGAKYDV